MKRIKEVIRNVRMEYDLDTLELSKVSQDPVQQFAKWMQRVIDAGIEEPNIMNLATVTPEGKPASRIVLLRNFDDNGFVFYTNYHSQKGRDLEGNPYAALNFFWPELHKQVRIEGEVSKVDKAESDEYFGSRPRESQVGAWASLQSQKLVSREDLDLKVESLTKEYEGREIPRPVHWGGYRVEPVMFEFWQGRINRLHDRIRYDLQDDGIWKISLLYP